MPQLRGHLEEVETILKETLYTLAAVFSVITGYYFLIPVWNSFETNIVPIAQAQITDTAFLGGLGTIPNNLNVIIQYSFVALLIGLLIYLALVPFREESTSYATG